jgi:glycosyltransferase involved in cell wall biosynthesis
MPKLEYILVTPAKNEANFIEATIQSVLAQRYRPRRWAIVDDGSTDATAEIIRRYSEQYAFIHLVQSRVDGTHNFASKVRAFNAGMKALQGTPHDLIGNLDADIVLEPDYYSAVVAEFESDPRLGLAGGPICIPTDSGYRNDDHTEDSIGGAVQLFRRECFKEIGGYLPLTGGGIDAAAEIMARMRGWTVKKLQDKAVYEQRQTGYAHKSKWKALYKEGVQYHRLGYHPLFYSLRSARRMGRSPLVVGSAVGMAGYLHAKLRRDPVCLPSAVVSYLHSEQMEKLWRTLRPRDNGSLSAPRNPLRPSSVGKGIEE